MILSSTSVMFMTYRTCASALPQEARQDIDRHKSAEIADVSVVVNGRSTGIHANLLPIEGLELLDFSRHRVVEI